MSTEWNSVPKQLYDALVCWRYSKPNVVRACGKLRELVNEMIAASPQPAQGEPGAVTSNVAQPEQLEPGVLTDERIDRIFDFHNEAPTMDYRYEVARAIEREVLSTRKLSDEQVARIMEAVDTYGERRWTDGSSDLIYQPDKSLAARAEVERLLRGEA